MSAYVSEAIMAQIDPAVRHTEHQGAPLRGTRWMDNFNITGGKKRGRTSKAGREAHPAKTTPLQSPSLESSDGEGPLQLGAVPVLP